MSETEIIYPRKSRELHNALMDSRRWDNFPFRDDDIVIATWAKSGTTCRPVRLTRQDPQCHQIAASQGTREDIAWPWVRK